jgi:hypothetical protein
MRLPKQVVRIVNAVTKLALLVGIPRYPYTPGKRAHRRNRRAER